MSLRATDCKSCGADIVWMKTMKGKNIPVDAETVGDMEAEIFDPDTMETHFSTCPDSNSWRKKK